MTRGADLAARISVVAPAFGSVRTGRKHGATPLGRARRAAEPAAPVSAPPGPTSADDFGAQSGERDRHFVTLFLSPYEIL
jgi:hypothetical protein